MNHKRSFIIYMVVFGLALIVSGAFLVWFDTDTAAKLDIVNSSAALQYLVVISAPVAEFSAGALVAGALVRWRDPKLSRVVCIVLRVVSLVMLVLAVASPLVTSGLPDAIRILLAVAVFVSVKLPVTYVVAGALLGLSLARPAAPSPESDPDADPFSEDE